MRAVKERLIVRQDWFETDTTKTGWDSHGWYFGLGDYDPDGWDIVEIIRSDKFGNPTLGIMERTVFLNQ